MSISRINLDDGVELPFAARRSQQSGFLMETIALACLRFPRRGPRHHHPAPAAGLASRASNAAGAGSVSCIIAKSFGLCRIES